MSSQPVNTDSKPGTSADSFIGRAAVESKLATVEEVQACIAKTEEFRRQGREVKLAEILIKAGVITKSQLKRLLNVAEDSHSQKLPQIPGFQMMQKIGAGAMAHVFKAKQLSLDRIVAIKILPRHYSEDRDFVERFYKEGRAAAKLNHNNIVQAIDVGEYAGNHYFVMEFVDGKTVYDELVKNRVYSEAAALEIVVQVAKALEHAHARGLIHRDVKPKNVMITKDGTAKLADMGLARQTDDAAAAEAEKGRAFGTPYYIAPEQIRGLQDVDFRADIYSLGAMFYHMVTGKVPFEGASPTAIMQKHLKQPLVPPDHLNKSLSTGLAEIIERMMAKDRARRYQSTTDLLIDLTRIHRGEAPLQARTGVGDEVLQNLAGGSSEDYPDLAMPSSGTHAAWGGASTVSYPPWLVTIAVVEFLFIVILALLLAFAR